MKNNRDNHDDKHDETLSQLLRDVEIPRDLQADLKTIPNKAGTEINPNFDVEKNEFVSRQNSNRTWVQIAISIAAALAVLMILYGLVAINSVPKQPLTTNPTSNPNNKQPEEKRKSQDSKPEFGNPSDVASSDLEEFRRELEMERHAKDLIELRNRAATLRRNLRPKGISSYDRLSIAKVLAKHAEISFGRDEKRVEKELKQIIQQSPESPGAKIARDLVSTN